MLITPSLPNVASHLRLSRRAILGHKFSTRKNLSDTGKIGYGQDFFRPNFKFGHYVFHISIVRIRFGPSLASSELSDPKKPNIGY